MIHSFQYYMLGDHSRVRSHANAQVRNIEKGGMFRTCSVCRLHYTDENKVDSNFVQ